MPSRYWRRDPDFQRLCDLAASNQLVCITGAGISRALPRANSRTRRVPEWRELLAEIFRHFRGRLSAADVFDCEQLLHLPSLGSRVSDPPSGRDLIAASSILRAAAPREFDDFFRRAVTSRKGSRTPTHDALLALKPRGILTFNYDDAHENAARHARERFILLLPEDEAALREAITNRLSGPFLLKAHGSIRSKRELVLTRESYRHLLVRAPAYRAFVQNLLTNFHFFMLGFSLSDPDFELFLDNMVQQFGSPLHEHIALFHRKERSPIEVRLRRQYGIRFLHVTDFSHIPLLIRDAATTPGPRLRSTIQGCLSAQHEKRAAAHKELQRLGKAGQTVAGAALRNDLETYLRRRRFWEASEIAYSLGRLNPAQNKTVLMNLVETADHALPIARALTVLREVLGPADLPRLRRWRHRFESERIVGERSERLLAYIDYYLVYVSNKFQSDPVSRAGAAPQNLSRASSPVRRRRSAGPA